MYFSRIFTTRRLVCKKIYTMEVGRVCALAFVACLILLIDAKVIQVTDENWGVIEEGEWMLKFYAPWCPACKAIAPVWTEFSLEDKNLGIQVGEIDVSASPGLSGRFLVTSLPTFYHVRNGEFRVYTGSRNKEDFVGYIAHKRYTELEPVSSWKAPNSIIMSAVSLVFQLSMKVRILVFITDYICPTRQPTRPVEDGRSSEDKPEEAPITSEKEEEEETQDEPTPPVDETTDQSGHTLLRKRKTETDTANDEN
ncbi:thioredoxin-related transmembrane protein 1-like isoform X2 [Acanthaster planci]|uniref:Thioredoxin-related transmembrane protein 1-like isoform X2 n=1 Tax=Acanthaster planci TaxID=133434 RepID=A0A8B7YWL9_ACAPL|nr:thioredoxin-related transmembrane protein 1-like isoform X2 [Acanthaster planci]